MEVSNGLVGIDRSNEVTHAWPKGYRAGQQVSVQDGAMCDNLANKGESAYSLIPVRFAVL